MRLVCLLMLVAATATCRCQDSSQASAPAVVEGLPGVPAFDAVLAQRLAEAVAAKGPAYRPRTRHKLPDGSPVYTNRLALASSPYLTLHAHNPVNWYEWSEEAFEQARRENKPVFLSIGYSTCHWCHVMAEESFEDEDIARVLNRDYVAIKVDREERPDLDQIYMTAVQRMTGDGGWPLSVWLLPDRRPFFGGTYFPPRDGARGARVGLSTLLARLSRVYVENPGDLADRAGAVVAELQRGVQPVAGDTPTAATIRTALEQFGKGFDRTWGGFGGAPKFPRPAVLDLLLRYARRTGDAATLEMVTKTLERMAAGGIYDHIGGGFHRYATDAKWRVPHFEKMLYDNAQLAAIYLDAYQATGHTDFAGVARETLDYLLRELRSPDGCFYSASDADSDGHEGTYFVWTAAEIDRVVGAERGRIVREYFDVTTGGNFERGANVLWRPLPLADVAGRLQLPPDAVRAAIGEARPLMFSARAKRNPPAIDRKVLTSWNALAISALARAAFVLDEPRYRDAARDAVDILLARGRRDGRLLHAVEPAPPPTTPKMPSSVGAPPQPPSAPAGPGFLDDHAFLVAALLDLYAVDPVPRWLHEALALQAELDKRFGDPAGGYFFTPNDHETLLVRDKPDADEALPAGNSVAALALLELYELTADEALRTRAEATIRSFGGQLARAPTAMPMLLAAVERSLDRTKQIVLVSTEGQEPTELLAKVRAVYLPNRIVVRVTGGKPSPSELAALVDGKVPRDNKPTAYVCIGTQCERPTSDPAELARQLAKIQPL